MERSEWSITFLTVGFSAVLLFLFVGKGVVHHSWITEILFWIFVLGLSLFFITFPLPKWPWAQWGLAVTFLLSRSVDFFLAPEFMEGIPLLFVTMISIPIGLAMLAFYVLFGIALFNVRVPMAKWAGIGWFALSILSTAAVLGQEWLAPSLVLQITDELAILILLTLLVLVLVQDEPTVLTKTLSGVFAVLLIVSVASTFVLEAHEFDFTPKQKLMRMREYATETAATEKLRLEAVSEPDAFNGQLCYVDLAMCDESGRRTGKAPQWKGKDRLDGHVRMDRYADLPYEVPLCLIVLEDGQLATWPFLKTTGGTWCGVPRLEYKPCIVDISMCDEAWKRAEIKGKDKLEGFIGMNPFGYAVDRFKDKGCYVPPGGFWKFENPEQGCGIAQPA